MLPFVQCIFSGITLASKNSTNCRYIDLYPDHLFYWLTYLSCVYTEMLLLIWLCNITWNWLQWYLLHQSFLLKTPYSIWGPLWIKVLFSIAVKNGTEIWVAIMCVTFGKIAFSQYEFFRFQSMWSFQSSIYLSYFPQCSTFLL